MSEPLDPEERFAEDLRAAFPAAPAPQDLTDRHVEAMMAEAQLLAEGTPALEQTTDPTEPGRTSPWRKRMRERMFRRVVAVVTGALLSLGGLAVAAAVSGGDPADDQAFVTDVPSDDLTDVDADDDENEDADEDVDDQDDTDEDENEDADDRDDADENDDADDQREDAEHEDADDEREGDDHDGGDSDDERETDDDGSEHEGGEEGGGGED